jgi:hypothetical protein
LLLGIFFVAASSATWSPLVDREVARSERIAAATQVFNVHDEIFLSQKGNPIGIRLRYSIRFPNSDYFWHSPLLQVATDLTAGIWADGRITNQVIQPLMLSVGGVQRYEKGKTYDFTTDFIPNFLIWSADKTRQCIVKPPPEYATGFEELRTKGASIRYRISIAGTKYQGFTENEYNPKTFYESAEKEGAVQLQGAGFGGAVGSCK